ncbi:bacterial low temperature requirement A protein-domain-containing protein [Mycena alexandri]|uniref:Bacterial low temperature requirement A protein-domain-containing protein n=1 Tax=Mycena alexandri TaxID=1745969 RepID=A0AAD6SQ33_9AGAR|nr:bacterial low temperature requirement A protein-domain-containing protein [Mycena alexandri]
MDANVPLPSPEELQHRIATLETDLQAPQIAREEADAEAKKAETEHHAARNFALYGPSDRVIFVQPEDYDQGLIYQFAKGQGPRAATCRFLVRYNVDRLLQRPRLHQWMSAGKIYREAGEQQSSRFELFFDLLFVGMVHQISEAAADQPTGLGFAKYILTFVPVFSIWGDVRDVANQFSNDDVTQRVYILWIMMLLVGYSNNASAIELGSPESEDGLFTDVGLTSMHWMLGFFVVAKASRVVSAILFLIAIFTSLHVAIALVVIAVIQDHLLGLVGMLLYKTMEILGKKRLLWIWDQSRLKHAAAKTKYRFPATNIEHHVERLQAFVTIVLGEMVVNVFFKTSGPVGLNMESGRAFLSLMIAFNFNWIYFGSHASKHFIHAIRRSWFAGFLFTFLHLPLCMSLLLASSAVTRFVSSPSIDSDAGGGLKWFFGAGLGVSLCTMATIGVLHKSLDDGEGLTESSPSAIRRTINRKFVIGLRYLAGLAMILVPLAKDLNNSTQFLAIYVGITAFLIFEETIGQIEKREQDLEAQFEKKEEERF